MVDFVRISWSRILEELKERYLSCVNVNMLLHIIKSTRWEDTNEKKHEERNSESD